MVHVLRGADLKHCGARLLSRNRLADRNPTAALEALDLKPVDHTVIRGTRRDRDARKQHRHAEVVQMRGDVEHILPGQRRSRLFEHVRGQKRGDVTVDDATVAVAVWVFLLGVRGRLPIVKWRRRRAAA